MQKLYNAVTAKMYDDWIELPLWMAGFMEGRQTLKLSFAVQQAFEKSMVMARGCWITKLDVKKAFDNMDHPEFASLCATYGIHPSMILSTLKEWEGARTTIEVNGFGSRIKMLAGGRQGGRDTPKLWNILLFLILKDLVEEWEEAQLVWTLPERDGLLPRLYMLAWADDLIIFAMYGTLLPPVWTVFGAAANLKQQPPKTTKPQWKEGPLFKKFGLKPEMVRTPRCHRRGHKQPADIRTAMKNYPATWRSDKKEAGSWTAIKFKVDGVAGTTSEPMPATRKDKARQVFDKWLEDRSVGDVRVIRNVTLKHEILEQTGIIPGFRWRDFDHTPDLPKNNWRMNGTSTSRTSPRTPTARSPLTWT